MQSFILHFIFKIKTIIEPSDISTVAYLGIKYSQYTYINIIPIQNVYTDIIITTDIMDKKCITLSLML